METPYYCSVCRAEMEHRCAGCISDLGPEEVRCVKLLELSYYFQMDYQSPYKQSPNWECLVLNNAEGWSLVSEFIGRPYKGGWIDAAGEDSRGFCHEWWVKEIEKKVVWYNRSGTDKGLREAIARMTRGASMSKIRAMGFKKFKGKIFVKSEES